MRRALLSLLPLLLAGPAAAGADEVRLAQLWIRERITIRVPRLSLPPATLPAPMRWREKKGPACVAVARMAGALIASPRQVDLVLLGGERVRAVLDGACQPLDYYSGFYIRPNTDGMACAGRDTIRVRSGAACGIARFRSLQPVR